MADKKKIPLAIGDHVRLRAVNLNQHSSQATTSREPLEGLVLAIREISSGKLVTQTKGDSTKYVVEIVSDHSFSTRYASQRNAPRGSDKPSTTAAWRRLATALRDGATTDKLYSTALPNLLTDSPLAGMLDGWRVVKVWSDALENMERPKPAEAETA